MSTFIFSSENNKFGDATLAAVPAPPPPTNSYRKNLRWAGQYAPPDENSALNATHHRILIPRMINRKLADLGTYLDHRVIGLSPEESTKVDKGYGQFIDFISKLQRVRELPLPSSIHPPPASLPPAPLPLSIDAPCAPAHIPNPKKQKFLLPPSPEKMQKRHQSFGVH
ncbi:hypothetical protein K438DRAFT_1747332 [Mycena galopus ATCC 62051]|nr:hypothetical protein K438DRAFT_1747332 [Mycena galopus ATCC 62051]